MSIKTADEVIAIAEERGFPCLPGWDRRRMKIRDVYPNFGRKKETAQ